MKHGIDDVRVLRQSAFDRDRRDAVVQPRKLIAVNHPLDATPGILGENFVPGGMITLGDKEFDHLIGINKQASTFSREVNGI